ncbi:MAG: CRISPR-associated endonuclease Cas3'' [Methanosarcinales archaeon]|nr:CRISPR-associated endonuclease Cas3'' [Methanosarcinales archaeon]
MLKSHPNKPLIEHLRNVGLYSKKIIISKKLNLPKEIDVSIISNIALLIGFTHDFGKATSYFQKRLENKTKSKFSNHAHISAIFTYFVVKKYLSEKNILEQKYYKYFPIISFFIVKRHHGNLKNADDEVNDEVVLDKKKNEILEKQIESIDFDLINSIYKNLLSDMGDFEFDCNIIKKYKNAFKKDKKLIRDLDDESTLFYYFIQYLLYSTLLDADKIDAANLNSIERIKIDENLVDDYKRKKFLNTNFFVYDFIPLKQGLKHKINTIREEIYQEVISKVKKINLDNEKILSLNVPTGTGKTLTAFSFALKLRARIECEKNYTPRIIYSLPFLSIIDQNFDVFEDVFKTVLGNKPTSDILLKHHHLSDIAYSQSNELEEEYEKDLNKDLLLIEGWNSEIIVTTFIQFFYTIISKKNRSIRKFHNIINSIVILDEVQTIPHKYWLLLNKMMKYMADNFNVYFIFITATLPLIFDEYEKEIIPLVDNKKKYFDALNRVKVSINLDSINIDEFKDIILKDIYANPSLDFLIVLNTIKSSKEIYNFIAHSLRGCAIENQRFSHTPIRSECAIENQRFSHTPIRSKIKDFLIHPFVPNVLSKCAIKDNEFIDNRIFYLSTNVIPKSRLLRIKEIKNDAQMRKIIVSTQLIEAGVDIDVDVVYRDFAPLDSINQVAGRCNRNAEKQKGLVNIFTLKKEDSDKEYYSYIYENFIIDKTKDIFKEIHDEKIEENEFISLNEKYFKKINIAKSDDKSKEILKYVEQLKFSEVSNFKLIENDYPKVDVFIELDEDAKKVWHEYQNIQKEKNLFERKNKFLKIKAKFYEYVISVNKQYISESDNEKFNHISLDELENFYDLDTGFKNEDAGTGTIIT